MTERQTSGGFGAAVTRREDARFVTGRGRYVDDVVLPAMLHMAIVRADIAHARLLGIDTDAATQAEGVIAVLTGSDLVADGLGDIPCESIPPSITRGEWHRTPFPALVTDRVLAVGDPLAVVIAETRKQAIDAAELVVAEMQELPVVASMEAAIAPGAPLVYDAAPGNLCFDAEIGDAAATQAAFARAMHVVELATRQPRVAHAALEPRGSIGSYDAHDERYTLTTSTQNPHNVRKLMAEAVFRLPANRFRVVAKDVGGGFGLKGRLYPEDVLVLWASRRVGRPVKWVSTRSEAFLSDFQGRDQMAEGRLALDGEGRILALDVTTRHNLGCRLGPATGVSPFLTARMLAGPYTIPAARVRVQGVFSNTRTTTSYRGAGRPEATYFLERMLDKAARRIGLDPVEIRRRNLIPVAAMPYRTALLDSYDCGEFHALLDKALELADWSGFETRKLASAAAGRLRGRGLAFFVEVSAISNERMELRFDPSGRATIVAGTFSHGQGHHTVYTQMVHGWLGLPFDGIGFIEGDTDAVSYGGGTYASRSVTVGGSALRHACDAVIAKGKGIAAWLLEAEPDVIDFAEGIFSLRDTNRTVSLIDVAQASYRPMGFPVELGVGLEAVGYYSASPQNYPNGCHVVEVEIDPDFGSVHLVRYTAVDDVGAVANPLLLEGQLHGSIAQGLGQALAERIVYDDQGQLLTAAFTEYAMPRAHHMPPVRSGLHLVPTATNPLGVKGGAEVGTIAAPPAILQAIDDALGAPHDLTLPVTASAILAALDANKKNAGRQGVYMLREIER